MKYLQTFSRDCVSCYNRIIFDIWSSALWRYGAKGNHFNVNLLLIIRYVRSLITLRYRLTNENIRSIWSTIDLFIIVISIHLYYLYTRLIPWSFWSVQRSSPHQLIKYSSILFSNLFEYPDHLAFMIISSKWKIVSLLRLGKFQLPLIRLIYRYLFYIKKDSGKSLLFMKLVMTLTMVPVKSYLTCFPFWMNDVSVNGSSFVEDGIIECYVSLNFECIGITTDKW